MDVFNERSTVMVTIAFKDENGVATTPSAATYRIDAVTEGHTVLASTAIGSLSTSVALHITSAQNAVLSQAPYSERVVTVEYDYGTTKHGTAEYRYKLKNLLGVT